MTLLIWLQMQFQVYPFSLKTSALWLPRQMLSFTWPFTRIILAVSVSVTRGLTHTQIHAIHFVQLIPEQLRPPTVTETCSLAVLKSTSYFLRPRCTHGNFPSPTPARCKTGVGEKARNRHLCLSRTGDKASPACPGLCLSLVSRCGGCATERHT